MNPEITCINLKSLCNNDLRLLKTTLTRQNVATSLFDLNDWGPWAPIIIISHWVRQCLAVTWSTKCVTCNRHGIRGLRSLVGRKTIGVRPGSYFLKMWHEFGNTILFLAAIFARELSTTQLLRIFEVNTRFAFASAGSVNRAHGAKEEIY